MKVTMKKLNHKGSALQIVLVIFMLLNIFIISTATSVLENARGYKRSQEINTMRVIEVVMLGYYKQEVLNGILFSDDFMYEEYHIYYTIDDMSSYYAIDTYIEKEETVHFLIHLDLKSLLITKFEYQ